LKLKQIKTIAELESAIYAGRPSGEGFVDITTVDGTIKAARVGSAHFRMEAYGTVGLFREIEHEEADRYRLIAKAQGFKPQVTYHESLSDLRAKQKSYGDTVETDDNSAEQVKVLLNDNGDVVREVMTVVSSTANTEELTF
jgi:hypothetical protein